MTVVERVAVAGVTLDPCMVLAAVQAEHGRAGFGADPEASRATVTVLTPELPGWAAGDTLHLAGPHGPVFTGRITDRVLEHPEPGTAAVTVTATGALAQLGRLKVGDEPWPVEPAQDRAARILALADPPGGWDVQAPGGERDVTRRDVDAQTPLQLLTDLTATTGGAVFDTPSGRIVYQPLPARQTPIFGLRWLDLDPGLRWRDIPWRWRDAPTSPASRPTVPVAACLIEWEPQWTSAAGTVINSARVAYGPEVEGEDRPTEDASDPRSIAVHGLREARLDSQWQDAAAAAERARRIITTQARDRWEVDGASLILDDADPDTLDTLLGLRVGDRVQLQGLPAPSPGSGGSWTGLVEGWTVQQAGEASRMVLRLSDPLLSLAVQRWRDAPPALRWQDMGSRRWRDLETWEAA